MAIMLIRILLSFAFVTLLFGMMAFVTIGAVDFAGHYKKIAPKCFNFMFWRNKYAPEEIPLVAVLLKLIAVVYCILSIVSAIIIGVLSEIWVLYIFMGASLGINLLYSIALAIVRTKFDKDESLY